MNRLRSFQLALFVSAMAVGGGVRADWIDTVARALGISKSPSAMRGPGDDIRGGDILVVAIDGSAPAALTTGGSYRSPVFIAGDMALLALEGQDLVRVLLDGGAPTRLRTVREAVKLLGIDRSDTDRALLLIAASDGSSELAVLSLKTGKLARLPHDRNDRNQRILLSHLRGEDREYEGVSLYLKTESKPGLGGSVEWKDVYVKRGNNLPVNLSRGDGTDYGQPALSHDGRRVAYVRAAKKR
jgi:hypothetical protein